MQAPKSSRSLDTYLKSAKDLERIAAHAEKLRQLQQIYAQIAPDYLVAASQVANFKSGKVVIHAANGAVAAKIRQFGPRLADDLSNKEAKVTQIEVRVQARNPNPPKPPHERPNLPGLRQKQGLTSLAQKLPGDSPLKRALERLLQSVKE